ncbi:AAA domain protein, partial [Bordetella bronchiseptica OSU553]
MHTVSRNPSMLPIVIVSGPPGSGKTTACGLLAQAD